MHGINKEEESAPAQEVYTSGRDSTLLAHPGGPQSEEAANEDRTHAPGTEEAAMANCPAMVTASAALKEATESM